MSVKRTGDHPLAGQRGVFDRGDGSIGCHLRSDQCRGQLAEIFATHQHDDRVNLCQRLKIDVAC